MAEGYYYHMGHCWARFEHGGLIRVGFDDFLVKTFGVAQELNLPPLGATLKQNKVGWSFGRDGNKAAVLSPVSGTLLSTNYKAIEHPEITNQDPYQSGWLFILEPKFPKSNLRKLYDGKESFQWIEKESQKLMGLIAPKYEKMAATGGEIINDLYGKMPDLGWEQLVDTFLHTEKI
jgi:glycine cleavage system H lipoate-binding protein